MRIQHNIPSMNAYRNYNNNSGRLSNNLEKLSSGYRINRAGDDAAGLAISEKMRAQISGLEVAQKNAKDGISLVQTAEGALTEVQDMLNRMYSLAEQSANGTYDKEVDRAQLQKEVESLRQEINRIGDSANFNGIKLLDGALSAGSDPTEAVLSDSIKTALKDKDIALGTVTFANDVDEATQKSINELLKSDGVTFKATLAGTSSEEGGGESTEITYGLDSTTLGKYKLTWTADEQGGDSYVTITDKDGTTMGTFALASSAPTTLESKAVNASGTIKFGGVGPMTLQVGDTPDDYNKLAVSIDSVKTDKLGAYDITSTTASNGVNVEFKTPKDGADTIADIDISTQQGAADALDVIKNAINYVSDTRGGLGAIQNRLDHTINNLSVMQENMQDAESTIRDTDVADEMMKYTKNNILVQSAQAMLAQANQIPQGVLQLLQ